MRGGPQISTQVMLTSRQGLMHCLPAGSPIVSEEVIRKHTQMLASNLGASIPGLAGRCAVALGHVGLRRPLVLPNPSAQQVINEISIRTLLGSFQQQMLETQCSASSCNFP